MQKVVKHMQKEINDLKNNSTVRRQREELNEIDPLFTSKIALEPILNRFKMLQTAIYYIQWIEKLD